MKEQDQTKDKLRTTEKRQASYPCEVLRVWKAEERPRGSLPLGQSASNKLSSLHPNSQVTSAVSHQQGLLFTKHSKAAGNTRQKGQQENNFTICLPRLLGSQKAVVTTPPFFSIAAMASSEAICTSIFTFALKISAPCMMFKQSQYRSWPKVNRSQQTSILTLNSSPAPKVSTI